MDGFALEYDVLLRCRVSGPTWSDEIERPRCSVVYGGRGVDFHVELSTFLDATTLTWGVIVMDHGGGDIALGDPAIDRR